MKSPAGQYRPSAMTAAMTIGALSAETGTPISTLRFYERTGLLGAPPRVSGQRRYPAEAAERVAMIRLWRRAGFSVAEIQTLLADRHRLDGWQDLGERNWTSSMRSSCRSNDPGPSYSTHCSAALRTGRHAVG